jgi:hypothetical protein
VGGAAGTDWTIHVSHSTDAGQTWSKDVRTITNAKNPSLAVTSAKKVGLLYQQFTGSRWVTKLEVTANNWSTAATTVVLHTAPSGAPPRTFLPYIGDYVRLLALDRSLYGVFSGNNTPDPANFPSGVTYQRHANWTTHTLLNTDNVTPVQPSIDPFFFHWTERPIVRGPITRTPIQRKPILPIDPIVRTPIQRDPGPITPIQPITPIRPPGPGPDPVPPGQAPTDVDL